MFSCMKPHWQVLIHLQKLSGKEKKKKTSKVKKKNCSATVIFQKKIKIPEEKEEQYRD